MLAIFALLGVAGIHAEPSVETIGAWSLTITRDDFTDQVTCTARQEGDIEGSYIESRNLSVIAGSFQIAEAAQYRVDGGPLRPTGPEIVGRNFLAVASAYNRRGIAYFYDSALMAGSRFQIRSTPSEPVVTFDISDYPRVKATMRAYGCGQE